MRLTWDMVRSSARQLWAALCGRLGRGWALAFVAPLLALPAVLLAYQSPQPVVVNLGSSYSLPYLEGFHAPEESADFDAPPPDTIWRGLAGQPLRTGFNYAFSAQRSTLRLPGVGRGRAGLEVHMGWGVPGAQQTLSAGDLPLVEVSSGRVLTTYQFVLPPQAAPGGTLELTWAGGTIFAPGDPRPLGLAVDYVEWYPLGWILPAWDQVLWVALAALALYLLARRLQMAGPVALALAVSLVALLALGLAQARMYVTIFTPRLTILLAALALLLPPLRRGARAVLRRIGCAPSPAAEAWLWRIIALAAIVKLGGVIYPHLIVLDVFPHANRIYNFLSGDTLSLFTPGIYSLLGYTVGVEGGQFPYSPLFHILSFPLALLPIPLRLAMGLLNGVVDVAAGLLLFVLAAKISGSERVGLWTAFLYTWLPMPYYLLSWGNYPTQLGLFGALVAVTFMVVHYERLGRRPPWALWVAVLVLALFSYTVVGLLALTLLLGTALLDWITSPRPAQRRRLAVVLGGILLAEVLVFLLYHSNYAADFWHETLPALFQAAATKAATPGQVDVEPRESLLSNWVANWIFVRNRISNLAVVAACAGIALLVVEPARRRWRPLLLFWPLVFVLFGLFSGLVADMVLKHIFIMFPWLCLGAAVLLERLWRRGPAGRAAVVLYCAWMIWLSLSQWLDLLLLKRHF